MTPRLDATNFMELQALALTQPIVRIDYTRPVWIFGAGKFGRSLAGVMQSGGIDVAGFIETKPSSIQISGLPVVDWHTLAGNAHHPQIALGIFNHTTPYDHLLEIASNAGFNELLMPWDTYTQFRSELGWRYWLSPRETIISNLERIGHVAEHLADNISRYTLYRLCAFRLGQDLHYSSFQSPENQYFNSLTLPPLQNKPIKYLDCGAYNGDTYIDFVTQPGIRCHQAFLMEPDPENYASLVRNVSSIQAEAICLPLAAADKNEMLTFSSGQGEGSTLGTETGDIRISAVALDDVLSQTRVDLIKLDVEGSEVQALKGAAQLIKRSRPILAISIYHKPQDLWEIPELLIAMCTDYTFHIRQHSCNSFDCVLYAIPARN